MSNIFLEKFYEIIVEDISSKLSIDEFLDFLLKNLNKNQNLITEEIKQKIKLPALLIDIIKDNLKTNCSLTKISGNDIFNCLKESNFFNKVNFPDVIVCKFDFSNLDELKTFIGKMTDEFELTEKQLYILKLIHLKLKSSNGLFTNFNKIINVNLMLFNSQTYTDRTIEHELTHYLQTYTNFGLSKINFNQEIDYEKFRYLNLDESVIDFLIKNILNKREYIPTVDNFIYNLNHIYAKYFKNIETEFDFINRFIKIFTSKSSEIIFNSNIFKHWKDEQFSLIPLYMFCILKDISPKNFAKLVTQLLEK
jgi:hypothetical protein